MKDKPQLSAEMEKRLKKLFYKEYLVKSDPEDYIHEGLDSSQQYSHLKAFLATALEEQRLQYVRKVEGYYGHIENDGVTGKPLVVSREDILKDIFAIFNGKDTNEK